MVKQLVGYIAFWAFSILLYSCNTSDTEVLMKNNYDIADAKWFVKDAPSFTFEVTDYTKAYDMYYNVRNNRTYPYYNLYVTHYLTDEKGKMIHQKLDELLLFDPTTGKQLGDGLGDIFDHRVLGFKGFKFPHKGKYKMQVRQYMRQDPIPDIISIGVSIESKKAK